MSTETNTTVFTEETYITFRRQWRTDYKELSGTIRRKKFDTKRRQRNGECAAGLQSSLHYLRQEAREAMQELKEMKEKLHALKAAELDAQKAA
jgi:hypothetical protein